MKLIGAGLPRTATTTQMIALEMLGMPCYHMRDMMMNMETSVPQFRKALEGDADWDEIFEGKESEVDWPASYHWRELIEVYPGREGPAERARCRQLGAQHAEHDQPGLLRGHASCTTSCAARYQHRPAVRRVDRPADRDELRRRARRWVGTSGEPRRDGRGHGALEPVGDRHRALGAAARLEPQGGLGAALRVPRGAGARHPAPARQRHGELPEEPDHGSRDRGDQRLVGGERPARGPADEAAGRPPAQATA